MLQLLQPPVAWRRVRLLFQTTLTYRGGNSKNFADDKDQTNQTKDPDEFERFKLSLDLLLTFTHLPLVSVDFPVAYCTLMISPKSLTLVVVMMVMYALRTTQPLHLSLFFWLNTNSLKTKLNLRLYIFSHFLTKFLLNCFAFPAFLCWRDLQSTRSSASEANIKYRFLTYIPSHKSYS